MNVFRFIEPFKAMEKNLDKTGFTIIKIKIKLVLQ